MIAGSDLTSTIQDLIARKLAIRVTSPDADLLADNVLDSVTLVQLILQLEQHFNIRIELGELEIDDFRSIDSIAALVQRLKGSVLREDFALAHATGDVV